MEMVTVKAIKDPVCEAADFNAEILVGRSILIYGQSGRRRTDAEGRFSRRFEIGDQAEYHSYNLRYHGPIVSIGAKCITIDAGQEGRKRLPILGFCRRNWDFDLARIEAENAAERVCL